MKQFMYIANFKNYFTLNQVIAWTNEHKNSLNLLATQHALVLCPSFEALYPVFNILEGTQVLLGAQDCSPFGPGAHTGHVLAESLKQIGCTWTIIGHSETQIAGNFTTLRLSMEHLLANDINPILCIGETEQDFKNGQGPAVIEHQIYQLFGAGQKPQPHKTIAIAYEPTWAINRADPREHQQYLAQQLAHIKTKVTRLLPQNAIKIFYGGGVNEMNAAQVKQMPHVDGFLIGKASTDFQKLQKIVGL